VVNRLVDVAIGADDTHPDLPWFQFVKGLAEYRQGRFASANEWMQKALRQEESKELEIQTYVVLAMTKHQLHQPAEARSALEKGMEIIDQDLPKLESGDIGGYWVDWVFAHVLYREAKTLIEGEVTAGPFIR
jgi:tetratricopeptide (TPR) repeat protein